MANSSVPQTNDLSLYPPTGVEVVWDLVVSSGVTSVVRAFGKLG